MLGPFWLTISTGVMVGALGFLYSALFHMSLHEYLPFLALSQVLWGFLATIVGEACSAFTESEVVIRSVRMPFFLFSIRILVRNVLVLGHNICVIVVVYLALRLWPGADALWAIPALPLWIIDALALSLLLGGICGYHADRRQRDADRIFHVADHLEAVAARSPRRLAAAEPVLRHAGNCPRPAAGGDCTAAGLGRRDCLQRRAVRPRLDVLSARPWAYCILDVADEPGSVDRRL
jgi:lipopolysaccharide transport system permease protein